MSVIIAAAFAQWRECRAEYNDRLYSAYELAERETNGALLNAEGRARNVDPLALFMGNQAHAHKYASEELLEHWQRHPRVTFADFERQWQAQHDEMDLAG